MLCRVHPSKLAAALAVVLLGNPLLVDSKQLDVGDHFPDLGTFTLEGTLPTDWKGKIILVDFWASWCEPCRASLPILNDIQTQFARRGVLLIGISVDRNSADMQRFLKRYPASFTIVRDKEHRLVEICDIDSMPTSFLLDRNGVIRSVHSGFYSGKTGPELIKEIEALLE